MIKWNFSEIWTWQSVHHTFIHRLMGDVHDIVCDLVQFKCEHPANTHPKTRTPRPIREQFVLNEDQLIDFVTAQDISLQRMNCLANELHLTRTSGGRAKKGDRIGYGFSRTIVKHVSPEPKRHLFYFGRQKSTGLYRAREYDHLTNWLLTLLQEHLCIPIHRQEQRGESEELLEHHPRVSLQDGWHTRQQDLRTFDDLEWRGHQTSHSKPVANKSSNISSYCKRTQQISHENRLVFSLQIKFSHFEI